MKKIILLLMIMLIILSLISGSQSFIKATDLNELFFNNEKNNQQKLYRITPSVEFSDLPAYAEIVGGHPGKYHDVLLFEDSISSLIEKGYDIETIETEIPESMHQNTNKYHSLSEMEQILFTINENYGEIISLFSIGKSYEDRDIWCIEITDNPGVDEGEPGVLFIGLHHAREWPSLEICLHIIDKLTNQYENDSHIKQLVDNRRIWIVPCLNPDGYHYCHDQGHDWRKNRRYLDEYNEYGIDLNRNYAGSTNGIPLGMWGSTGTSHNPDSSVYCGENQFSEYETQSIKDFFINNKINSCISWHTYSELVLWSWGYSLEEQTPNDAYMSEVGMNIASRITKQGGSGHYIPHQSAGLYPTTGDTTDWMYGYSHYVLGRPCFAYTIEACASFHPDANVLDQVCKENMDGALYLIEETINISKLPQRVIPPDINEISNTNETCTLTWELSNTNSNPLYYEIEKLSDIYQFKDTSMQSVDAWIFNGFSDVSYRAHSDSQSYYSSVDSRDTSAMTTRYPFYVNESIDTVSFYCWFDTGNSWSRNKAFFEVSTNGRDYQVIDTFSGESNDWIKKEYSLNEYIGESIYFQFRYSKSSSNNGQGFYVDDISPVTYYYEVESLDDNIRNTEYIINKHEMDDSFVRIRGYNEEHGWCDWSQLHPLQRNNGNTPPEQPSIQGPQNPKKGEPSDYIILSNDTDDDKIYYLLNWGDGTTEEWKGPYSSGEEVIFTHTWDMKGNYQIKVKAKDEHNMTSEWSILDISLQKTNQHFNLLDYLISYLSLLFNKSYFF